MEFYHLENDSENFASLGVFEDSGRRWLRETRAMEAPPSGILPLQLKEICEGPSDALPLADLTQTEMSNLSISANGEEILSEIIRESGQFYDVQVKKDGRVHNLRGFCVCHTVDCLNLDLSRIKTFSDGTIMAINHAVMRSEKLPLEVDLFRLAGVESYLIVSERFVDRVTDNNLTGLILHQLSID